MIKKVLEYQQRWNLIEEEDRIVAGFSGGADSVCLLLMLRELQKCCRFSFCAVHVEHGIRGAESLADADYAKAFCEEREIPFYIYHVDAPRAAKEEGLSLEEAARKLRYECFEQAREAWQGNKIAVAHHADDNAETMLFHMARGTGLKGLSGIPVQRDMIIRPLLAVTRYEIEAYLAKQQIEYCTDSTNSQEQYARNRLRLNVLPQMRALNVRAVEHMSSLGQQVAEVYAYLTKEAWVTGRESLRLIFTDEYGTITEIISGAEDPTAEDFYEPKQKWLMNLQPAWCIDKTVMAGMEPLLQREFLHQILGMAAGSQKDISMVHVESLRQLFASETGKQIHLPYGLVAVSRYQDVCLKKDTGSIGHHKLEDVQQSGIEIDMDMLGEQEWSCTTKQGCTIYVNCFDFDGDCEKIPEKTYTKWFDYDKIKDTVLLRTRQTGDYLTINQAGNQKKLKEYFINEKIPQEERDRVLLMADGSHVMWVIGHRISDAYKVTPKTKRILQVRAEKENER